MPSIHENNEETVFARTVHDLSRAVTEAFDVGRPPFPALILLYSSLDIVASLSRPISQEDTSGEVFKKWVDTHMLPDSGLTCSAQDVWAARCGILHTLSLQSRLSRCGSARVLTYVDRPNVVDEFQDRIDPTRSQYVVVALRPYAQAFLTAIIRFTQQVQADPELRRTVEHHVRNLAAQIDVRPSGGSSS